VCLIINIYVMQTEPRRCCLKLHNLMPVDSGNYTCVVSNPHGQLRHTYLLEVFCMHRVFSVIDIVHSVIFMLLPH